MSRPDGIIRQRAVDVLIAHQRHTAQHCLCGWGELGHSHAEHVVEALDAAGVLRRTVGRGHLRALPPEARP